MKKIIVANRGEIASRAIWSLRSLGYETIALYSKEDRNLPFLNNADYAYEIGSGVASKTYENVDEILRIKNQVNADAIYIGYGFLYDNKKIINEGNLISPNYDFISKIKDKYSLKESLKGLLKANGINTFDNLLISNFNELTKFLSDALFPLIIKPNVGKYSKAISIINNKDFKESQFNALKMESYLQGFKDKFVVEPYLKDYKEISVLALRDKQGNITVLPEVDTSISRSFSWVLAESPAQISETSRNKILESTKKIAEKLNLIGLINLEFFVKGEDIYFSEINPGLSVWYSLSEQVSQIDIIKEQVKIFNGELLLHNKILKPRGNSVIFKIFSENPLDASPSFGKIDDIFVPIIPNIRTEYTAFPGWQIPIHYDNMLGKISFWANNRQDLVSGAKYLMEKHMISGVDTNISYLFNVVNSLKFKDARYNIASCENIKIESESNIKDIINILASINKLEKIKNVSSVLNKSAWNKVSKGRWKEGL